MKDLFAKKTGFTLVELMVSLTILVFISILIFNAITNVEKMSRQQKKSWSSIQKMQVFFEQFSYDMETYIFRNDIEWGYECMEGVNSFRFFGLAKQRTSGAKRPISLVEYKNSPSNVLGWSIERNQKGIDWDTKGIMGIGSNSLPVSLRGFYTEKPENEYVILDQVVAFRLIWAGEDGAGKLEKFFKKESFSQNWIFEKNIHAVCVEIVMFKDTPSPSNFSNSDIEDFFEIDYSKNWSEKISEFESQNLKTKFNLANLVVGRRSFEVQLQKNFINN